MLKASFTVYISVYDTKEARNVSSQKAIVHLIVFKYDAFSASYVIKWKLILLKGIDNNECFQISNTSVSPGRLMHMCKPEEL